MKTKPVQPNHPRTPKLARILVPTDFSRHATRALQYAVPLAQQVGGKVTLLHAIDMPVVPAQLGALMTDEARLTAGAQSGLDQLAARLVPGPLLGKTVVRLGRAHEEIARAAKGQKIDLIVLAMRGRTGLQRALLGSTAERVVRHASCPVLTVRPVRGKKPPAAGSKNLAALINRILVPVDFSAGSQAVVRYAAGLARSIKAGLALLHVVEPPPLGVFAGHEVESTRYLTGAHATAQKELARLATALCDELEVEVLVREGHPAQGITLAARDWRSDLIVLSTRGLTGLRHIVLGSTAEAVVRHAPCPVLTIGRP
jgi:nucleotide-binding universal stress UspA family protein